MGSITMPITIAVALTWLRAIQSGQSRTIGDCHKSAASTRLQQSGRAYLAVGKIQQAIQDFDAQIEIDPRHASAFGGRAQAYLIVGDAQRALADVERALELQPNEEYLLRMRGITLLDAVMGPAPQSLRERWLSPDK